MIFINIRDLLDLYKYHALIFINISDMLAVSVMARSVLLYWQLLSYSLINTTATVHRGALSPLRHLW